MQSKQELSVNAPGQYPNDRSRIPQKQTVEKSQWEGQMCREMEVQDWDQEKDTTKPTAKGNVTLHAVGVSEAAPQTNTASIYL